MSTLQQPGRSDHQGQQRACLVSIGRARPDSIRSAFICIVLFMSTSISSSASDDMNPRIVVKPSRGAIQALAVVPDSSVLAIVGIEPEIKLIDTRSGEYLGRLKTGADRVKVLAFSGNGRLIASTGIGSVIRVSEVPSLAQRVEIDPRASFAQVRSSLAPHCLSAAFSPDGLALATGHIGGVRIWSLKDRRLLCDAKAPGGGAAFLRYSSDGETLAVGGQFGGLLLIDTVTNQVRDLETRHHGPISSLDFVDGGRRFASSSTDYCIVVWDVPSRRAVRVLPEVGQTSAAAYIRCSNTLVTASSYDKSVRFFNLETEKMVEKLKLDLFAHEVPGRMMVLAPNPLTLCVGTFNGTVLIYDLSAHANRPNGVGGEGPEGPKGDIPKS